MRVWSWASGLTEDGDYCYVLMADGIFVSNLHDDSSIQFIVDALNAAEQAKPWADTRIENVKWTIRRPDAPTA